MAKLNIILRGELTGTVRIAERCKLKATCACSKYFMFLLPKIIVSKLHTEL